MMHCHILGKRSRFNHVPRCLHQFVHLGVDVYISFLFLKSITILIIIIKFIVEFPKP